MRTDSSLNRNFKHLSWDKLTQFINQLTPALISCVAMDNDRKRIDLLFVYQNIKTSGVLCNVLDYMFRTGGIE